MSEPFTLVWEDDGSSLSRLVQLICCVNDRPFRGHPTGSLMVRSIQPTPFRRPDGQVAYRTGVCLVPTPSPSSHIWGRWLNDPNFLADPWLKADFAALIPAGAEVQPA